MFNMMDSNSTQSVWSELIHTAQLWNAPESAFLSTLLLIPLHIPFFCRLAALILAIPFALCIGLDVIAYAIARTLHLSMSQARVPRSPPEPKMTPLDPEARQSVQKDSAARVRSPSPRQPVNEIAVDSSPSPTTISKRGGSVSSLKRRDTSSPRRRISKPTEDPYDS